jgi:hypothetical protein
MVSVVHEIYRMDSQDIAGPIFYPLIVTSSVFQHNQCCRGGGQARSAIGATACTDYPWQSDQIYTFQQISPVFFYHIFVHTERGVMVPPNLHKCTLVAPSSMRDDLHRYLLPLLLQLFRILNVYLNSVFEEFVIFIFGQVNPYRINDTLC